MPLQKRRATSSEATIILWLHWLLTLVFAAAFVLVVLMLFKVLKLSSRYSSLPEALLLLSGVACTVTSMTRRLPLQNVLLAAVVIAVTGGAMHTLGALTDIPFGPFAYGPGIGSEIFNTLPWTVPLIWVLAVLNSRGVARLILRPWRKVSGYGFWLIGMTAALTVLFDFALEPFAGRVKHYWIWIPTKFPLTWDGVPASNFLSWAAVALLIALLIAPALINKQPGKRNVPDFHPFAVWLGLILLFGTGCALRGLWDAAVADGILAVVITIFAIRGGTW